jgi:hypothetical protein
MIENIKCRVIKDGFIPKSKDDRYSSEFDLKKGEIYPCTIWDNKIYEIYKITDRCYAVGTYCKLDKDKFYEYFKVVTQVREKNKKK